MKQIRRFSDSHNYFSRQAEIVPREPVSVLSGWKTTGVSK
jgi:hypothetical protein